MADDKLTRREAEEVLRRAADLEGARDAEREDGGLTSADLVRLGEEAGLSPHAVERALVEARGGAARAVGPDGSFDALVGPGSVLVTREVPVAPEVAERALERFMREQLMSLRRRRDGGSEWERATGLWPGLARSLPFARRYALAPVTRVETRVVGTPDGGASVTFAIDMTEARRDRLAQMCVSGASVLSLGLLCSAMVPGFGAADLLALLASAVGVAGVVSIERRRYREGSERAARVPDELVDRLVRRVAKAS